MRSLLRALAVVTFYVVTLGAAASWAHSDAITKCNQNIKYSKAVKVGQDLYFGNTGFYAEHYDTNDDGKFDVVTLSHTDLGVKFHHKNPVFWLVDIDFDGLFDFLYIDKQGLGKCEDIVLYEDMRFNREESSAEKGRRL